MNASKTNCSRRLDDAIWSSLTAYNTHIGIYRHQLVYGKAFHLPVKLDHKDMWAMKKLKMGWNEEAE